MLSLSTQPSFKSQIGLSGARGLKEASIWLCLLFMDQKDVPSINWILPFLCCIETLSISNLPSFMIKVAHVASFNSNEVNMHHSSPHGIDLQVPLHFSILPLQQQSQIFIHLSANSIYREYNWIRMVGIAGWCLSNVEDNKEGWGPTGIPEQYRDVPFLPYSKGERLGRVAALGMSDGRQGHHHHGMCRKRDERPTADRFLSP